jgi:integrase
MAIRKREWTNQDGSVGSAWQVGYSDVAGKWRTKQYDRKRDAEVFFQETKRAVRQGAHVSDAASLTFADAAKKWLDKCRNDGCEKSTLRQYDNHIRNHISPALGSILLTRLTRAMSADFRDELLKVNSRVQARKIFVSFKAILSDAESRGLIAYNPAASIKIGKDTRTHADAMRTRVFPQPAEIRAIIDAAPLGFWRAFLITVPFTGLSSSELRGLHWEDGVDFDRRRIHVRRRADEFNMIGKLKAEARYRSIPMTPEVETVLREWRLACPRRDGKLFLVFPNSEGNIEAHTNLLSRGFHPVQIAAGIVTPRLGEDGRPVVESGEPVMIAKYGLHDLRHFFASWLIEHLHAGPKRVQTLMGHSSIKMTYDVYGHLFEDPDSDDVAFAAAADRVMSRR